MNNIKQVIVIRKDLKMRRGKEISQGAHASMAFLKYAIDRVSDPYAYLGDPPPIKSILTPAAWKWLQKLSTKITLQVNSEKELIEIYEKAEKAGLEVHIIQDAGLTEFDGVSTYTCLAIGPDLSENIDPITKDLKLY